MPERADPKILRVMIIGHQPATLEKEGDKNAGNNEVIIEAIHRNIKWLLHRSSNEIYGISGMAFGPDQSFARICVELSIPFTAALPFDNFLNTKEYRYLLSMAEKVVFVSPGPYAGWKYAARNRWMVDNSDIAIMIYDPRITKGEVFQTRATLEEKKKPIIWIKPGIQPKTTLIRTGKIL